MSAEEPSVEDLELAAQESESEAEAAEQLLESIVEQLTTGSDDVTAEDLQSAKGVAGFARLRAEGARNKVRAARTALRNQLLAELDDAVKAALAPGQPLHPRSETAALEEFAAAVRKAASAYMAHRQAGQDTVNEISKQAGLIGIPRGWPGQADGLPADTSFAQYGDRVFTPSGVVGEFRHGRSPGHERSTLKRAADDAIGEVYR